MTVKRNKYGLSRDIPPGVKLAVRQKSGFGCVMCGLAIYDYEHIYPEFADAHEHDPEGITLLCPTHHALKTRKQMSSEKVLEAMRNPYTFRTGFTFGPLDYSDNSISVVMGDNTFIDVESPIVVGGIPMLSMLKPEEEGAPIRLSAIMAAYDGTPMLSIGKNEWRANTDRWDVKIEANRITIKNAKKNVGLKFRHEPREAIYFEAGRIAFAGLRIDFKENEPMKISTMTEELMTFSGNIVNGATTGLHFGLPPELVEAAKAWIKVQGAAFSIKELY